MIPVPIHQKLLLLYFAGFFLNLFWIISREEIIKDIRILSGIASYGNTVAGITIAFIILLWPITNIGMLIKWVKDELIIPK